LAADLRVGDSWLGAGLEAMREGGRWKERNKEYLVWCPWERKWSEGQKMEINR
jgi:hypothetical protein